MRKIIVALVALTSIACSAPDRRYAQVVATPELQEATGEAITNWQSAVGSEIDWIFSDSCDDSSRTCVHVHGLEGDVPASVPDELLENHPSAKIAGYTDGYIEDWTLDRMITIEVARWMFYKEPVHMVSLLTHEMGHALGIKKHTIEDRSDGTDVMSAMGSKDGHDCIGAVTLQAYNSHYGSCSEKACQEFCW